MSDVKIVIDTSTVDAMLEQILNRASNLQPAMIAIGHEIAENVRLTFRDTKTPNGQQWQALSPVTIKRRRQNSSVPLNDTGRLRNSIAYQVTGNNVVDVGTDVKYAAVLNFGAAKGAFGRTRRNGPIPWGNIPARQFMPTDRDFPTRWEQDIADMVSTHFGF